jgi:hypothetical protein
MGIVFSLAWLYVYIKWSPFSESEAAALSVVVSYSLTFLFVVALLIKAGIRFGDDIFTSVLFVIFLAPLLYIVGCNFLKHSSVVALSSIFDKVKTQQFRNKNQKDDAKDNFSAFHVVDDLDIFLMCDNALIQNHLFIIQNDLFMDFEKTVEFDSFLFLQDPDDCDIFLGFDPNPSRI